MLNKIILIAGIVAASTCAASKSIGIKGGFSLYYTKVTFIIDPDFSSHHSYDTRVGPGITVFGNVEQNRYITHNFQMSYFQAGGIDRIQGYTFEIILDYFGIGYNFQFRPSFLKVIPYLSAGLSIDYLGGFKTIFIVDNYTEKTGPWKGYNKFNLRPLLTAGLEYDIAFLGIVLEYNYSYGFFPFFKEAKSPYHSASRYITNGHIINAGLLFKL